MRCYILILYTLILANCIGGKEAGNASKLTLPISQKRLKQTILMMQNLKSRRSWNEQQDAAAVIMQLLEKEKLSYKQEFYNANGKRWQNIIVTITGKTSPRRIHVIIAHYDSISSEGNNAPGADDNGSGAAAASPRSGRGARRHGPS